jgi:hypothetical protein
MNKKFSVGMLRLRSDKSISKVIFLNTMIRLGSALYIEYIYKDIIKINIRFETMK